MKWEDIKTFLAKNREEIKLILWITITVCFVILTLHIVWPDTAKPVPRLQGEITTKSFEELRQ